MRATRRRWLGQWPAWRAALGLGTMAGASANGSAVQATPTPSRPASPRPTADRMPGDPPEHHVVYQLNHAEVDHIEHILNSIGALIGRHEDNVAIAVVAFGPGIHLLARKPRRPVPESLRERARSQARDYGVRYIACGNTMKTLGWTAADMADFVKVEEVGAAVLMELQEQGWAYIAW